MRARVPAPAAQTWSGRIKLRRSGGFFVARSPAGLLRLRGRPCRASRAQLPLPLSQERSRGEPSGLLAARRIILLGNPNGPLHESRAQSARGRQERGRRWGGDFSQKVRLLPPPLQVSSAFSRGSARARRRRKLSVAPVAVALRVRAASSTHASLKPSWSCSANHGSGEALRQTRNVPAPQCSAAPGEGGGRRGGRSGRRGVYTPSPDQPPDPRGGPPPPLSSSGRINPPEPHGKAIQLTLRRIATERTSKGARLWPVLTLSSPDYSHKPQIFQTVSQ